MELLFRAHGLSERGMSKEGNMAKEMDVFKCEKCKNIVEVRIAGDGTLVCCDQPMILLTENSVD